MIALALLSAATDRMLTPPGLASIVETLTAVAKPWKHLYDDSKVVATVVVFVHLASLLIGGGIALATDRATLRASRGTAEAREKQLAELGLTHRVVVPALAVSFVSGVMLFFTDVGTYATSLAFWVKMALVALLLLNGLLMTRVEDTIRRDAPHWRDATAWRRLHVTAIASVLLWMATLLAGVALTNAS